MSRNHDIKRFDAHPAGQPIDLLGTPRGKLPVVLELLGTGWLRRGSEVQGPQGGADGSRPVEEPCEVEWDAERRVPVAFTWRGRRRPVEAVAGTWTVERAWWDRRRRVSRRCFRVLAAGGVYVIAFDRLTGTWVLAGLVD
jgi:hypothetical protein